MLFRALNIANKNRKLTKATYVIIKIGVTD